MSESQTEPVVYATQTGMIAGIPVKRGEAWAADDPLVTGNPGAFSVSPQTVRRSVPRAAVDPLAAGGPPAEAPIERGTRAPGERRRIRRGTAVPPGGGTPPATVQEGGPGSEGEGW